MGKIAASIAKGAFWPICAALFALSSEALAETATPDTWQLAQPATVSLSDEALEAVHQDIESGRYGYIDAFLVARHGKLVFEQ